MSAEGPEVIQEFDAKVSRASWGVHVEMYNPGADFGDLLCEETHPFTLWYLATGNEVEQVEQGSLRPTGRSRKLEFGALPSTPIFNTFTTPDGLTDGDNGPDEGELLAVKVCVRDDGTIVGDDWEGDFQTPDFSGEIDIGRTWGHHIEKINSPPADAPNLDEVLRPLERLEQNPISSEELFELMQEHQDSGDAEQVKAEVAATAQQAAKSTKQAGQKTLEEAAEGEEPSGTPTRTPPVDDDEDDEDEEETTRRSPPPDQQTLEPPDEDERLGNGELRPASQNGQRNGEQPDEQADEAADEDEDEQPDEQADEADADESAPAEDEAEPADSDGRVRGRGGPERTKEASILGLVGNIERAGDVEIDVYQLTQGGSGGGPGGGGGNGGGGGPLTRTQVDMGDLDIEAVADEIEDEVLGALGDVDSLDVSAIRADEALSQTDLDESDVQFAAREFSLTDMGSFNSDCFASDRFGMGECNTLWGILDDRGLTEDQGNDDGGESPDDSAPQGNAALDLDWPHGTGVIATQPGCPSCEDLLSQQRVQEDIEAGRIRHIERDDPRWADVMLALGARETPGVGFYDAINDELVDSEEAVERDIITERANE